MPKGSEAYRWAGGGVEGRGGWLLSPVLGREPLGPWNFSSGRSVLVIRGGLLDYT